MACVSLDLHLLIFKNRMKRSVPWLVAHETIPIFFKTANKEIKGIPVPWFVARETILSFFSKQQTMK